ncbi:MAG: FAD-binding dehydrogenase [Bacteroidota bacterium]
MTTTYQADVIIVGGGLAGIVTALELLDQQKKVLILDRDVESELGGLAKWAFGGMFFVDSKLQRKRGIDDSIDLAMKDWFSYAEFADDEVWGKKWAEQYIHLATPHAYRWLKERKISFFPVLNWAERGLHRHGNSVPRFHMVWGTGWGLVKTLAKRLVNHPNASRHLQICYEHRVHDFVMEAGKVVGVQGKKEGSGEAFDARANVVVAATGGINGSLEKVREHWYKAWGAPPERILNGAHKYAIGDLHEATSRINGSLSNLDLMWNYAAGVHHPNPRKPLHGLSLVPSKSAVWLNYQGRRIGPEPLVTAFDTRFIIDRICEEEKKYTWQVLNMKIAKKEFAISGSESNPAVRDKKFLKFIMTVLLGNKKLVQQMLDTCEDFVVGNSVEELADKMNALTGTNDVDVQQMKADIAEYDRQIRLGPGKHNDEQLRLIEKAREYRGDRVRTCNFQPIVDRKAMPLIAIREFIVSRKSLGGIQTDLQSRVLTRVEDGPQQPIEGLYAVGEAAGFGGGGVHGKRALEGTFLSGCVITARVAAASILGKSLD